METTSEAVVGIAWTTEKHRSLERVTALVREAVDLIGGMGQSPICRTGAGAGAFWPVMIRWRWMSAFAGFWATIGRI